MKDRLTQMILKVLDLKGQGGRRDVQLSRSLGKAHVARGGVKSAEGGQRWQAIIHI